MARVILMNCPLSYLPVALLTAILIAAGCHAPPPPVSTGDYETVAKNPRRDSDRARRENEEGLAALSQGNYAEAEAALRQALADDVTFGPAHNNLGMVYYHQQRLYLAAWEFQYAIKLMPNQPEARNNLGLVFEAGGKLDQAVEAYEEAIKLEPQNPQYVGNGARARIRRGESGREVKELLTRLAQIDVRPEWVSWARQQLSDIDRRIARQLQGEAAGSP